MADISTLPVAGVAGDEAAYLNAWEPTTPGFGGVYAPYAPVAREDTRVLSLESLDGSLSVPLNVDSEHLLLPGATGLDLPPLSVVTAQTPGIDGAWLQEVDVLQRAVFLPVEFTSETSQAEFFQTLANLRSVVAGWGSVTLGSTGTFRLRVTSASGARVLPVVYSSGMEGAWGAGDSGTKWQKYGLNLIAVDPYWRSPFVSSYTFTATPPTPFISYAAGTANPWPRRIVNSFSVVGRGMPVSVGDVPVWPVVEVDGPAPGVTIAWPGTSITTTALAADETLTLTTDPRARSARINGQVAWSTISLNSVIAPLPAGLTRIDAAATNGAAPQSVTVEWTEGFLTAW